MLPLSSTRHVASNQSADVSAHSKAAFRMPQGQRVAPARRTKLGDECGGGAGGERVLPENVNYAV